MSSTNINSELISLWFNFLANVFYEDVPDPENLFDCSEDNVLHFMNDIRRVGNVDDIYNFCKRVLIHFYVYFPEDLIYYFKKMIKSIELFITRERMNKVRNDIFHIFEEDFVMKVHDKWRKNKYARSIVLTHLRQNMDWVVPGAF